MPRTLKKNMKKLYEALNYKNPDYLPIIKDRIRLLKIIRGSPRTLAQFRSVYKRNPGLFIQDWGCTIDPRNIPKGQSPVVPFILFKRQAEMVGWMNALFTQEQGGVIEKSREIGATWVMVAFACAVCLFNKGVVVGFGSRTQKAVDVIGERGPIFGKIRDFLRYLPREFLGGYIEEKCSKSMQIKFPGTDSVIVGKTGIHMGRGDKCTLFFLDEAAFLQNSKSVDDSLSEVSRCRIDVSTANGTDNRFYEKRSNPNMEVFRIHWRDDPRKDYAWYEAQCKVKDPVTISQELDIDYLSSKGCLLISPEWVQASINAHIKLKITPTGAKVCGFDVADGGSNKNALVTTHGILVENIQEWSGKNTDIFNSVKRVVSYSLSKGCTMVKYDSDGLGAGVRGDATQILKNMQSHLRFIAFKGSHKVVKPNYKEFSDCKNVDFFLNLKAQMWWKLRMRFRLTYRILKEGHPLAGHADQLISIPEGCNNLSQLINELAQPSYGINEVGKFKVNKAPDGMKSPDLADALMMAFSDIPYRVFI
jgi:phage terminase large subunit